MYILKDSWQVEDPSCLDELAAYSLLAAAGVPYILPHMIAGNVLSDNPGPRQVTTIQDLSQQPFKWRAPCSSFLRRYIHFRLVQNVAYPVQCLKNSQELIKVFRDVATCESDFSLVQGHLLITNIRRRNGKCGGCIAQRYQCWEHPFRSFGRRRHRYPE